MSPPSWTYNATTHTFAKTWKRKYYEIWADPQTGETMPVEWQCLGIEPRTDNVTERWVWRDLAQMLRDAERRVQALSSAAEERARQSQRTDTVPAQGD